MSFPNTLVPGFFVVLDPRRSVSPGALNNPPLVVGQMLPAGTATALTVRAVTSAAQGATLFGARSILAHMLQAWFANHPNAPVYAMGVADEDGTAAVGSVAVTATDSSAGTLVLYIAGRRIEIAIAAGLAATAIGALIEDAVNAADVPVIAANTTGTVAITARNKGTIGNQIKIAHSLAGVEGGEELPGGVALALTQPVNGATDPAIAGIITALGEDAAFDYVVPHLTTTTWLNGFRDYFELGWASPELPCPQLLAAFQGADVDAVDTFVSARNGKFESIMGVVGSNSPAYEWGAAYGARMARFLADTPQGNSRGQLLAGVMPGTDLTFAQRTLLLNEGAATYRVVAGVPRIELARQTYKLDEAGNADDTWQVAQVPAMARRSLRRFKAMAELNWGTAVLANDNATTGGGGPIVVTPTSARADLIAEAVNQAADGLLDNLEGFKTGVRAVIDEVFKGRLNIYLPPDFVRQLTQVAATFAFRR